MIKRETEKNRKINTEEYKLLEIEQTIMPFLEKKKPTLEAACFI